MILAQRNSSADGVRIAGMSVYNEDSIGRRIAWARKNVEWVDSDGQRHKGMTGHQLGRRLVTQGTASGVRNVYVSQLESNHASPSLPMLCKIAEVTGVTVGFLLMETEYPYRDKPEPELNPVYFSPEADEVARMVDDAPPLKRAEILSVLRTMARYAMEQEKGEQVEKYPANPLKQKGKIGATPAHDSDFTQRLIHGDKVRQFHANERTGS